MARFNKNVANGENYEYVGSEFACQEKLYVSLKNLKAGEYHIFAQVDWIYQEKCSFVISTYANQSTPLELLPRLEVPNNYLNQILTSLVKTKKKTNITEDVNFYYSIEDNHTGYFITSYENVNVKDSVYMSFEATSNQYVILGSKHFGSRDIENKIDKIGFYIAPGCLKTILFEVTDIYKSNLKIGKYHVDIIPSYLSSDDNPTKLYLSNHLEFLDKEQISNHCMYMELHENNFVYLIFMNNGEENYKIDFIYSHNSNLIHKVPKDNGNSLILRSHSFEFIKLEVKDNNVDYEVRISYKIVSF